MKIAGISIDGFGIFKDAELPEVAPGLVLFHGNNEAGKSTLLAFIKSILFGFPDGRTSERQYPPLAGGRHGGALTIRTSAGETIRVERYKGRGRGPVTITRADGTVLSDEPASLLVPGATRELFANIYAFSLEELNRVESLQADAIRTAIYGASAGSAAASLPRTLASLEQAADRLFKPHGSSPVVNRLLGELEDVRARLRQARHGVDEFEEKAGRLQEVEALLEATGVRLQGLGAGRQRAEALMRSFEDWLVLASCSRQLEALDPIVERFPEDGLARFETLQATLRERWDRLDSTSRELATARTALDALAPDVTVLAAASAILDLHERRGAFLSARERAEDARREIDAAGGEIARALANLGPEWTPERVREADRSVFTREAIADFEGRLIAARSRVERARDAVSLREDEARRAENELQTASAAVERAAGETGPELDVLIRAARGARTELGAVASELPQVARQVEETGSALDAVVRAVDPEWTANHVERFDISMTTRSRIDACERRIEAARLGLQNAELAATFASETLEEAESALAEARRKIEQARQPELTRDEIAGRRDRLRAARGELSELETLRARIAAVDAGTRPAVEAHGGQRTAGVALVAAALVAGIALAATGRLTEAGIVVVALVAAGLALVVLAGRARPGDDGGRAAELERLRALEREKAAALSARRAELDLDGEVSTGALAAVERALDETSAAVSAYEALSARIEHETASRDRASRVLQQRRREASEREADLRRAREEWRTVAAELGLRPSVEPRTASLVVERIERALGLALQRQQLLVRLRELEAARDRQLAVLRGNPALAGAASAPLPELLASIDRFVEEAERQREARRERTAAMRELEDRRARLEQARAALEESGAELHSALEEQAAAREAWSRWLEARGLPDSLSPATAREALQTIEGCDRLLGERERLERSIESHEAIVSAFLADAGALFDAIGRERPAAGVVAGAIVALADELATSRELASARERAAARVRELETACDGARAAYESVLEDVARLLEAGEAEDEESFRRRSAAHARRRELMDRGATAESVIAAATGLAGGAAIRAAFEGLDRETIETDRARLVEETERAERERDELLRERSDLKMRLETLASADEVATLRASEEGLLERIRAEAREWGRHAIARFLLEEAKRRFEAEKQPAVVREAARYFTTITGGRYANLIAPLGGSAIEVVDAAGQRKEAEALSRGAVEQLYLAIRFGYIENWHGGEALPIVMDDILVNADGGRARSCVEAILEIARTHQVIYFTCHEQTVALFREVAADVPVVTIADGRFVAPARRLGAPAV